MLGYTTPNKQNKTKNDLMNEIAMLKTQKQDVPILYMMVGLPASGKSTLSMQICDLYNKNDIMLHSSDKLREELYNDINFQGNNQELFVVLHRRIKKDLQSGKSVIYDATNIHKKRRRAFLRELTNIKCFKVAICLATPYEECLYLNEERGRTVPKEVITKMYQSYCPPHYSEGFDKILIKCSSMYNFKFLFSEMDCFNQENVHHSLSLGEHCKQTYRYLVEHNATQEVCLSGLLHDIGKLSTKTPLNTKGEFDGNYHYYNHEKCGAYDSFFYTCLYDTDTQIYIANLIYYHMHPYTSWRYSEKAKRRDLGMLGEKMFYDIMLLHEADLCSH